MRNKDVLKKLKNLPDNTKEYIDTNELVKVITDFEIISTEKIAKIYTDNLTIGKRYRFPFESYPNVAFAAIIKKYGDGTTKTLTTIRKSTDYIYVSAINGEKFDLYHRSAFGTMSRLNGSFGTTSSEYTSTFTKVVLDTLSDTLFEPTKDYHPATKKYVDDKVAGIVNSAPETLDTLQELATSLGNDPNFATTVSTQIGKKVDKVEGMTLTHNDLTNELKANYDAAYAHSQAKHSYNDLTDKPTIPDASSFAPITSPVFKKSISIGNVAPDKILGENCIIVSSYGEASGIYTLSNGKSAIARADYSHAEGYASMSKGLYSHAEGEQTGAIGQSSHSEGHGGDANGVASHAEGYYTTSNGKYSHAEGYRTIATGDNQHVQGKYNIEDKDNKYAHIVGNGYRDERNYKDYRSNGYTLDWSGNGWFAGKVTQEGTPTDDKDLVNKKYVDDANIEATDGEVDAMLLEVLGGDYSVQS